LDRFEGINAAEWDEVPESQSPAEEQEITPTRRLEFSKIENEKVRLSSYLRDQIHSIVIGRSRYRVVKTIYVYILIS
jgi:hypothetical protein